MRIAQRFIAGRRAAGGPGKFPVEQPFRNHQSEHLSWRRTNYLTTPAPKRGHSIPIPNRQTAIPRASLSLVNTRSGVMGSWVMRTPVAL